MAVLPLFLKLHVSLGRKAPEHPNSRRAIDCSGSLAPFDAALSTVITMDGDPAVEPELDSFSLTLPLPYRVALVTVLGALPSDALLHIANEA